ncbi:MAG: hypothetical protein GY820_45290 [Gammaproteobacteria bacterium]|nr:hypothetical protein [Gammaproteobacteria bacterium]
MLHHLADELPDNATWGDVAYQVELKASIEQGLKEADAGQLISQDEIEKEFGIHQ